MSKFWSRNNASRCVILLYFFFFSMICKDIEIRHLALNEVLLRDMHNAMPDKSSLKNKSPIYNFHKRVQIQIR